MCLFILVACLLMEDTGLGEKRGGALQIEGDDTPALCHIVRPNRQKLSIANPGVLITNRQKLSIANPETAYALYFFRSDLIFSLLPGLSLPQKKSDIRKNKKNTTMTEPSPPPAIA
jgi:hypothetical protein